MHRAQLHHYLGSIENDFSRKVLSFGSNARLEKEIASFTQEDDDNLSATWSRFKRMIRACPQHEYEENHLNTFFCDSLNDSTKALLDLAVGGQLSKFPCNQVKAMIKEVVKNSSWGRARSNGLPRGMIDMSNLDFIGAKIEAIMDKKLS